MQNFTNRPQDLARERRWVLCFYSVTVTSRIQELVNPGEESNKKGILLAVLVIVIILCTVALNILIFSPPDLGEIVEGER